jgi:hypothetical protein
MTTDDPSTYEPNHDELLTLNAALRLRLELTVSALRSAMHMLDSLSFEVRDAELLDGAKAAYDVSRGVLDVATGVSSDIPARLMRELSLHRQATAKKLLDSTR